MVVVLPARAENVFRGILISSGLCLWLVGCVSKSVRVAGIHQIEVLVEDLALFSDGSANNEQLLKYLNSRGMKHGLACFYFGPELLFLVR